MFNTSSIGDGVMARLGGDREPTAAATEGWADHGQRYLVWPRARALRFLGFIRRLTAKPVSLIAFVVLLTLGFVAAFAPWVAPYHFLEIDTPNMLKGPTAAHPMGRDQVGRDLLSRLMHAGRISLAVAVGSEAVALAIGVPIGLTAGFFRGAVDAVLMRIIDGLLAFPSILLALVIAAIFSGRFFPVLLAIGITLVPGVARIVRAGTLREKGMEYVTACYAVGASAPRIALRHILPNTFPELMVQITLGMAVAILIEATLSFLGLGVQPPLSSWGTQLKIGYREIWIQPWLVTFPGLVIFAAVWAFNVMGDALRDTLDPRLKNI